MDCGPTSLKMVAKHYGKDIAIGKLREYARISREGVSLLGISEAAEKIGFRTLGVKINSQQLFEDAPMPCILHWQQSHFIVLPPQQLKKSTILIADPAKGLIKIEKQEFLQHWLSDSNEGIALLLEPTPAFFELEDDESAKVKWSSLFFYLRQHRTYFTQVGLGLIAGAILQLLFPFLTQSIVDTGINTRNLNFIHIVLIAQLMLFIARTGIDFIRSRLLLFISTHINISLLTGFWYKLMKLPISYFDTKLTGDIYQRLNDQRKIESFLTGSSLSVLFSLINLVVFSVVLILYSFPIFAIFIVGSTVYMFWVRMFFKFRRDLNYKQFAIASKENTATMQLIQGMQEIKLHNAEKHYRWGWEYLQAKLFKLNFKSLSLSQYQQAGALFINEGKNIFITFLVAKLVIDGQLTLGAMLAIQYIIGQLNSPIEQLIGFSQNLQDAKIALERLNEIQQQEDEEPVGKQLQSVLPVDKSIVIKNLAFTYNGAGNTPVLQDINLTIPADKVTAIVGMSGSGKTTLLKLLLKFYENYAGSITIGDKDNVVTREPMLLLQHLASDRQENTPIFDNIPPATIKLTDLSPSYWRSQCGTVMQDGYIFNDTIEHNIGVGEEIPDRKRVITSCEIANIKDFVEELPLGLNTKIGAEGNGISQGQRQRLLIARAVYKNPEYLFFDEATNALDANNEKAIMGNMQAFFTGKTVVVVAHRLSTVKHADKIVVLHQGRIVEEGTHDELAKLKGHYYELVRNQLELGQ